MSFQQFTIIGNLGRDPTMRYTPTGKPVTSFSVASNRKYTASNGETVTEVLWVNVSAWGAAAEACNQYIKKGSQVFVQGRLVPDKNTGRPRIWTGQDGTAGATFEVNAQTVRFLGGKANGQEYTSEEPSADDVPPEDDIPF